MESLEDEFYRLLHTKNTDEERLKYLRIKLLKHNFKLLILGICLCLLFFKKIGL